MKRCFFNFIFIVLAFIFFGCSDGSDSSSTQPSSSTPKQETSDFQADKEVKNCFNLTNKFRTGNEAFYLNEDNTTKTNLVGQLGTLTLDKKLCEAAQIRAKEIVNKFEHTRPDGSTCFTVFNELSISAGYKGENIAAGHKSGQETFLQWKEDNENYDGQGHRRNMLKKDFTKIGLAYTYDANSKYKYYWVMILAN